jgi:hypothetical protein
VALSPGHRLGQIIGDILEAAVTELLAEFAGKHDLYLDKKGIRSCRKGKKCSWTDGYHNKHDLDFVLERGGTDNKRGIPVAFVEAAWRSYTKHSRNKAQEIQGAVLPVAEYYANVGPFTGAILAGVFTAGAIAQLESLGFNVLFLPAESVVVVFSEFGIDVAFDERTPDKLLHAKVKACLALSQSKRAELSTRLLTAHKSDVDKFIASLEKTILRQVESILILPLHGNTVEVATVDQAIKYVSKYSQRKTEGPPLRYEIEVRYNNGNVIRAKLNDKESAIEFLQKHHPIPPSI